MKIKSVHRSQLIYGNESDEIIQEFNRSEIHYDKHISKLEGLIVQDMSQLRDLITALIPEEDGLECSDSKGERLEEGESRAFPETVWFAQHKNFEHDETSLPVIWRIEIDQAGGLKKEQVSLTLKSSTLALLRKEVKETGKSLSAVVDAKLEIALGQCDADSEKKLHDLIKNLEKLCADAL